MHHSANTKLLLFIVANTLLLACFEVFIGITSGSLAVFSDAGHNAVDLFAYLSVLYADWIARKPAPPNKTYGYYRAGILATFLNSIILAMMAIWILFESYERFLHPIAINSDYIMVTALCAITINLFNSILLHRSSKHDLNIRSAFIHALGDGLAAFGILAVGIFSRFTPTSHVDAIVSLAVSAIILLSAFRLFKASVNILMEVAPSNISIDDLEHSLKSIKHVIAVHDLHLWTITSNIYACSLHVVIKDLSTEESYKILNHVTRVLEKQFGITHTTVQIEWQKYNIDPKKCAKLELD